MIDLTFDAVRVHLWDLSGNSDYTDVRNELYGATDAVFMVYDISKQASFDNLNLWAKELEKYGPAKPVVCVVGNKVSDASGYQSNWLKFSHFWSFSKR